MGKSQRPGARPMVAARAKLRGARRVLGALALGAAVAGCAAATPAVRPVTVRVPIPVPVYCPVPELGHPALPIAGLTPASTPGDTIRAYAASVAKLKSAVLARDAVIAACRKRQARKASPGAQARARGGA